MKQGAHSIKHSAPQEHKAQAPASIGCVVITCSDTRTEESDTSGHLIRRLLAEHGHRVIQHYLLKDEPPQIRDRIEAAVRMDAVQAIIINGGTGISRRDSTFEAIDAML
jgi:molybdenum cofactor biosynthesis protein B